MPTKCSVNPVNKDSKGCPKVTVLKKSVETETGIAEVDFVYVLLMALTINRNCVSCLFLINSRVTDGNYLRKV